MLTIHERYGAFEQLVQAILRQAHGSAGGSLKYHSSPLKGDRRYYFLAGETAVLEVACIAATDDAEWTFANPRWVDQDPRWNQFRAHERNEAFLQLKIRELKVRNGLPWVDA